MKKIIITAAVLAALLTGCGQPVQDVSNEDAPSMFTVVEYVGSWRVMYHNDTKVMYAVSAGSYNSGSFTVLVNHDGTPMLWEE